MTNGVNLPGPSSQAPSSSAEAGPSSNQAAPETGISRQRERPAELTALALAQPSQFRRIGDAVLGPRGASPAAPRFAAPAATPMAHPNPWTTDDVFAGQLTLDESLAFNIEPTVHTEPAPVGPQTSTEMLALMNPALGEEITPAIASIDPQIDAFEHNMLHVVGKKVSVGAKHTVSNQRSRLAALAHPIDREILLALKRVGEKDSTGQLKRKGIVSYGITAAEEFQERAGAIYPHAQCISDVLAPYAQGLLDLRPDAADDYLELVESLAGRKGTPFPTTFCGAGSEPYRYAKVQPFLRCVGRTLSTLELLAKHHRETVGPSGQMPPMNPSGAPVPPGTHLYTPATHDVFAVPPALLHQTLDDGPLVGWELEPFTSSNVDSAVTPQAVNGLSIPASSAELTFDALDMALTMDAAADTHPALIEPQISGADTAPAAAPIDPRTELLENNMARAANKRQYAGQHRVELQKARLASLPHPIDREILLELKEIEKKDANNKNVRNSVVSPGLCVMEDFQERATARYPWAQCISDVLAPYAQAILESDAEPGKAMDEYWALMERLAGTSDTPFPSKLCVEGKSHARYRGAKGFFRRIAITPSVLELLAKHDREISPQGSGAPDSIAANEPNSAIGNAQSQPLQVTGVAVVPSSTVGRAAAPATSGNSLRMNECSVRIANLVHPIDRNIILELQKFPKTDANGKPIREGVVSHALNAMQDFSQRKGESCAHQCLSDVLAPFAQRELQRAINGSDQPTPEWQTMARSISSTADTLYPPKLINTQERIYRYRQVRTFLRRLANIPSALELLAQHHRQNLSAAP
jgi:hypothetical protein